MGIKFETQCFIFASSRRYTEGALTLEWLPPNLHGNNLIEKGNLIFSRGNTAL